MKKGIYYIGDPCYIIRGDDWDNLLTKTDYFSNEVQEFKGFDIWAHGTAWGDGCYLDQSGREYPVDSGTIGIVSIDAFKFQNEYDIIDGQIVDKRGLDFKFVPGHIVEFEEDFIVYYLQGIFNFGDIVIDTDPHNDEPIEDDEDEFNDNDEDDDDIAMFEIDRQM